VHTPPTTKEALDALEEYVCHARKQTPDNEVDVEMIAWISDTRSSKSKETKYYKTINLYWHMKSLLGRDLTDKQATFNYLFI